MAVRFRPDRQADPLLATAKLALKTLAKRFVALDTEIKDLRPSPQAADGGDRA